MSEYLAGPQEGSAGRAGPAARAGRHASHVDDSRPVDRDREHVRFGIPFNGVVPIWHDDATITWHRPADGTDLSSVLGMGLVDKRLRAHFGEDCGITVVCEPDCFTRITLRLPLEEPA